MTKYRLKKDVPEFKAGSVFTRRKYEYGDYDDDCLFADISPGVSPVPAFDISLIDNFDEWFEEVGKAPGLKQKYIKDVLFGRKRRLEINLWFKEDCYCLIWHAVYGNCVNCFGCKGQCETLIVRKDDEDTFRRFGLVGLNQMIRDGHIEIEDNPNIVWEDEND